MNWGCQILYRVKGRVIVIKKCASEETLNKLLDLYKYIRWGRDVSPAWIHGDEVVAPAADTVLVSATVFKLGYIYGFFISAGEANSFRINWISRETSFSRRIFFGGGGSIQYVDFIALNEGSPADPGSTITITNVSPGSSGVVYQAALLIGESY